ncbi:MULTISPECIES: hypothetical protein [Priestia]|nr:MULTISPECIES: hypothetical protein [Priestia]MDY0938539.1 hypothetical protein [Priestia megaterium]
MPFIFKEAVVGLFTAAAAGLLAFQGVEVVSAIIHLLTFWKQQ